MGICYCYQRNSPQLQMSIDQEQKFEDSFLPNAIKNNNKKFLFFLSTYVEAEKIMRSSQQYPPNQLLQCQNKLYQHCHEMQLLLQQLNNEDSQLYQKISRYAGKQRILLFELTYIGMRKVKSTPPMTIRISVEGRQEVYQSIFQIKDYMWFPEKIFLEWTNLSKEATLKITFDDYFVQIQSAELNKYIFPICQYSHIHKKGVIQNVGKIFFRVQNVQNVELYKQKAIDHLFLRIESARHQAQRILGDRQARNKRKVLRQIEEQTQNIMQQPKEDLERYLHSQSKYINEKDNSDQSF